MKMFPVFFLLLIVTIAACHSPAQKDAKTGTLADTAKFYPLRNFFKEQIQYVDLRNFPIYRITEKDGKKDSADITKEQFASLAASFFSKDISDPKVKALYKESAFHDLSTGSITLNYKPSDSKASVQNIDILLDEQTNLVKRVFIRVLYLKADTTFTEQYNWKANKSFQINRFITATKGYTSTELNYINWNDKP
jgi:hypothetical protein